MKFGSVLLGLAFVAASVAALDCSDDHSMSNTSSSYWLCREYALMGYFYSPSTGGVPFYGYINGRITATAPAGHPEAGQVYRVFLTAYTGTSPYAATLKCYKRMQGLGSTYWWLYEAQVTLNYGEQTVGSSNWITSGCPPVMNSGHDSSTSPPTVQIYVNWAQFGLNGFRRSNLVAVAH